MNEVTAQQDVPQEEKVEMQYTQLPAAAGLSEYLPAMPMPEEQYIAPQEEQLRTRAGMNLAGVSIGVDTSNIDYDDDAKVNSLMEAINNDNLDIAKKALEGVVSSTQYSVDQRKQALQKLVSISALKRRGFDTLSSANVVKEQQDAYRKARDEGAAMQDGSYEDSAGVIERRYDPTISGVVNTQELLQTPQSTIAAIRAQNSVSKEDAIVAMSLAFQEAEENYSITNSQQKSKGLGADTIAETSSIFLPLQTAQEAQVIREVLDLSGVEELQKISQKYSGAVGGARAQAFYIGFHNDIAEAVSALAPEAQAKLAQTFLDYLKKNGNEKISYDNDLIEQNVAYTIFGKALEDPNAKATTFQNVMKYAAPVLMTAAGWADAVGGGALLMRGARLGGRMLPRVGRASKIAPKIVAQELAAAVAIGGDALKAVGATKTGDVVAATMPVSEEILKVANTRLDIKPALEEMLVRTAQTTRQLEETLGLRVARGEPVQMAKALTNYLYEGGIKGQPHISTIVADDVGENFVITGRFGADTNKGFPTIERAKKALDATIGTTEGVAFSIRHKETGAVFREGDEGFAEMVAASKANESEKLYEWFADLNYTAPIDSYLSVKGLASTDYLDEGVSWTRWAINAKIPFTRAPYSIWNAARTQLMKYHAGSNRTVQQLFADLTNPEILNLNSTSDWVGLNQALKMNAGQERLLTEGELISAGLKSTKGQLAYYAVRRALDISWRYTNLGASKSMASEGWAHLYDAKGVHSGYGLPIFTAKNDKSILRASEFTQEELRRGIGVKIMMNGEETVVTKSFGDLEQLLRQTKGTLYRNKAAEWTDDIEVGFTLIARDGVEKAVKVRSGDLVIPRAAGYFPEKLNANLVIEGVSKGGRVHALGSADTDSDALRYQKSLESDPDMARKFASYRIVPTQGLKDGVERAYRGAEIYENLNGLVYGHKGKKIYNASGEEGANYADPMEAVMESFNLLSINYTKGTYVRHSERVLFDWAKQKGILTREAQNAGRITGKQDFISTGEITGNTNKYIRTAMAELKSMEAYKNFPDLGAKLASMFVGYAARNWLTRIPAMQKISYDIAKTGVDPTGVITGLIFNTVIRGNAPTANVLNQMQAITNLGWPMSMARALWHKNTFMTGLYAKQDLMKGAITKTHYNKVIGEIAKSWGKPIKEIDGLVTGYMEGGLWNQVRHNAVIHQSAMNEMELQAARLGKKGTVSIMRPFREAASSVGRATGETLDAIGMPHGEHSATMTTYLTQYFVKNPDMTTQGGKEALVSRTSAMMGDMAPEGRVGFQRGAFKATFQFLAFPYKMAILLTPRLGDRTLSFQDQFRIMMPQMLTWGMQATEFTRLAHGLFLDWYVYDEDLPEDEQRRRMELLDDETTRKVMQWGWLSMYHNNMYRTFTSIFNPEVSGEGRVWEEFNAGAKFGLGATPVPLWDTVVDYAPMMKKIAEADGVWSTAWETLKASGAVLAGSQALDLIDAGYRVATFIGNDIYDESEEAQVNWWGLAGRQILSEMSPLATNFMKLQTMTRYNEGITTKGVTNKEFEGYATQWLNQIIGVQEASDNELFKLWNGHWRDTADDKTYSVEVKKQGDAILKQLFDVVAEMPKEPENRSIAEEMLNKHTQTKETLYRMLPRQTQQDVAKYVDGKIYEQLKGDTPVGRQMKAWVGEIETLKHDDNGRKRIMELQSQMLAKHSPEVQRALSDWRAVDPFIKDDY